MKDVLQTIACMGLAVVGCLSLTGCLATSGDLRELADRREEVEAGLITEDDFNAAMIAKAKEIEERASGVLAALPTTAGGWIGLGTAVVGLLTGSGVMTARAVNKKRDGNRVARSEPVKVPEA